MERQEENLGATQLELDTADLAEISAALAKLRIMGERYTAAMQRMVNR